VVQFFSRGMWWGGSGKGEVDGSLEGLGGVAQ
jgi:hypothetical protein